MKITNDFFSKMSPEEKRRGLCRMGFIPLEWMTADEVAERLGQIVFDAEEPESQTETLSCVDP